jgi:hypothetical protein
MRKNKLGNRKDKGMRGFGESLGFLRCAVQKLFSRGVNRSVRRTVLWLWVVFGWSKLRPLRFRLEMAEGRWMVVTLEILRFAQNDGKDL